MIMKKLFIVLMALAFASGVSAQHGIGGGKGAHYVRPRVSVAIGGYIPLNPYPYYGVSPYYGFSPAYGYGLGYGAYGHRPSRLDLKIEDIRNDYSDRIWSVKHDTSLTRKERRQKVHELRHERDQAITDAKRSYYKY